MAEQADASVYHGSSRKTWDEVFKARPLLKIAQNLGNDWTRLASCLGFERPKIENITADSRVLVDRAMNMLTSYRDGSRLYGTSAQIDEFIEALEDAGRHDLACKVRGEPDKNSALAGRPMTREVVPHQAGSHGDENVKSSSSGKVKSTYKSTDKVEICEDKFYKKKHKSTDVYPVVDNVDQPRGFAVIVNILKDRAGAEADGNMMEDLFTQLGYQSKMIRDQTKEEITSKLKSLAKDEKLAAHDSIVIFLMAHGQIGQIFDADGYPIHYDDLFEIFNNTKCPQLKGKPKLFFFQACRGVRSMAYQPSDHVTQPGEQPDGNGIQPNQSVVSRASDVLVAHATVAGHEAYRQSSGKGSRYPLALWEVFKKHAKDTHVQDLLTRVNRQMHDSIELKDGKLIKGKVVSTGTHQCAEMTSTLRKEFYFFPRRRDLPDRSDEH